MAARDAGPRPPARGREAVTGGATPKETVLGPDETKGAKPAPTTRPPTGPTTGPTGGSGQSKGGT